MSITLKSGSEVQFVTEINPTKQIQEWKDFVSSYNNEESSDVLVFNGFLDTCMKEIFEYTVLISEIAAITVNVYPNDQE